MPSKPAATPPGTPLVDDELYHDLLALGTESVADEERTKIDAKEAIDIVRGIEKLVRDDPVLAAKLATDGDVTAAFLGVGTKLAGELESLRAGAPPDLRRFEIISPEDEATIAAAVKKLGALRESAAEAARAHRRPKDADILGRGLDFNRNSAREVGDAIHQFVTASPQREKILRRAGIKAPQIEALAALGPVLDAIAKRQGDKRLSKSEMTGRIQVLTSAIGRGFLPLYRARVRVAASGDLQLMDKALAPLPRTERRTAAASSQQPPAAKKPETEPPKPHDPEK